MTSPVRVTARVPDLNGDLHTVVIEVPPGALADQLRRGQLRGVSFTPPGQRTVHLEPGDTGTDDQPWNEP